MPKILGLEPKQAAIVGVVAVGGIYLLTRSHAAPAVASADQGVPTSGGAGAGVVPAAQSEMDATELAARNMANQQQQKEYNQQNALAELQTKLYGAQVDAEVRQLNKKPKKKSWFSKIVTEISRGASRAVSAFAAVETGGASLAYSNPLSNYGRPTSSPSQDEVEQIRQQRQRSALRFPTPPINPAGKV